MTLFKLCRLQTDDDFAKSYSNGDYRYKLATLCFHQKCTKPLIDQKDCSYHKMELSPT